MDRYETFFIEDFMKLLGEHVKFDQVIKNE